MVQIKRILVSLDGSKNSLRGLDMTIFVAKQCGSAITGIFSFYTPPHSEFRGISSVKKSLDIEVKRFIEEANYRATKHGIGFRSKIMRGNVGYNIVKVAHNKKDKFDLIVMGSRGR
uniref:Universal stress protein A domain-containing protein n=1 Tax=uncultured archaeon W4-93a TaxID=1131007 RepID=H9BWY1_9ARCH|nr:universal stress protein A domain-containing protein [uncultured archaeon W4-93a]